MRQARARPVAGELKARILFEKPKYLPKSKMGEAVTYALGQWESFERYLENGDLEIDNNLVENAIRPTKLGAKNHLFFGSAEAGEHSALFYTLIANCRAQDIEPQAYIEEAIVREHGEDAGELTPAKVAAERKKAAAEAAAG